MAAGYPTGGSLQAPDAACEQARRAVADQQGHDQRQPTGEKQSPLNGIDVGQRVMKGRREQEHAPITDRERDLRELRVAPRNGAALEMGGPGRADRNWIVGKSAGATAGKGPSFGDDNG